jgi:predicted Ser/Thr protein kinase/streptogramin lyase
MADRVGTEIAGYRIEGLIGRGGMSVVYLAEHVRLGRKVALKLLSPDLAENEKFRERFLRESQIAASIDHPNIVPIYDADEADGALFIAMRYVEGTDLKELIRSQGPLEPTRTVSLVTQIASALDAAHAHGLVHRDVKPGNVLVTREDHVYVSDFGLTKRALSVSGLTKTGQLVGTIDYVAPEQIKGDPVDGRADVYSLGCLAYECLTAEVPYERDLEVAVLWAHVQEAPPKPSTAHPELPGGLDDVIAKAMAKHPDDRYATAGEFAADIGRACGMTGGEQILLEPSRVPLLRRRRWLIAAGGLLSLAVLAAGLVLANRGGAPPKAPTSTPIGVSRIDVTTGRVTLSERDNRGGWDLVAAEGALWEADPGGLVKRDDATGAVDKVFDLGGNSYVVAAGFGAIWLAVQESGIETSLVRIDPATDEIAATIDVSPTFKGGNDITWVATDHEAVWVLNVEGTLWRIDPIKNRITNRYAITSTGSFLTTGGGFVWVSNALSREVIRLDPTTGGTETIPLPSSPRQLAFLGGTLWVRDVDGGTVTPLNISSLQLGASIGAPKRGVEVGGLGYLWIAGDDFVWGYDPVTGEIKEIPVGFAASTVAPDERTGAVWVMNRPVE